MQTYARIDDGVVAELLATDVPPGELFHPGLRWVVADAPGVAVGWRETPAGLAAPPPAPAAPATPSIAELQARISVLAAQVAALIA